MALTLIASTPGIAATFLTWVPCPPNMVTSPPQTPLPITAIDTTCLAQTCPSRSVISPTLPLNTPLIIRTMPTHCRSVILRSWSTSFPFARRRVDLELLTPRIRIGLLRLERKAGLFFERTGQRDRCGRNLRRERHEIPEDRGDHGAVHGCSPLSNRAASWSRRSRRPFTFGHKR